MARTFTPQDAHAIMNLLVKEATGQNSTIQQVNSANFVSVGEQVLATGTENVLNSLALVLGRTFAAVRPYQAKLNIINALNSGMYANRMRKISFYSREAQESGDFNTQLKTNLAMGYDNGTNGGNSTGTMWEQNQPVVLEQIFGGQSVWEDSTTIYEDQLKTAFRDEASFSEFVAGVMTEKGSDIESQKEAFNRMTILNFMGGLVDVNKIVNNGCVVNLTKAFNDRFGTSYSSADLRTTYLTEFLEFFTAEFKGYSDKMTNRSKRFHWSPAKQVAGTNYTLLRHTPKDKQRCLLFKPLLRDAESRVFPEIFNPDYLDLKTQYEGVEFWQNENEGAKISVVPAIPDVTGNTMTQVTGDAVAIDYVVGLLYDEDALMIDYQLETANTSPLEARKRYRNLWWSFSKNAVNDFCENAILFVMIDED